MAILFDLDGVFYQGDKPIDGAAEVVNWVRDNEIPYLFITNTSSRPRSALVDKLAQFGIFTDEPHILTPPVATVHWLKQQQSTHSLALFIPQPTHSEFSDFKLWHGDDDGVTAVIVGDLGEDWTFQILNRAFRLLMRDPQPHLIALGMTRYWQNNDGLYLDVAPFIVALEHASNTKAVVMGKPANTFYQTAINILGTPPGKIIMVGDDIRSDVQGAQLAGMRGILVKTGKFRSADLQQNIQPDAILDSVKNLPDWWLQHHPE